MRVFTPSGTTVQTRARPANPYPVQSRVAPGRSAIELLASLNGPRKYKRLFDIYITNPWLFATIDLLSVGLARVVLEVHAPDKDGNSSPIPAWAAPTPGRPAASASLVDLLIEPEPGKTWFEWTRDMSIERKVYGNALAVKECPALSVIPNRLRHVPWPWVTVDLYDGEILRYVITYPSGREEILLPDEVIHWGRSMGREGMWGCSPSKIEALEHTVRLYDAIARHLEAFYKNSARLSGQLKVPSNGKTVRVLREEIDMLTDVIQEFYSGPDNAGKVLATTAEWQSISADPKSAAIVELKKLAREEIVAVYHVPPPLAGILESAIKSNVVELRSQYLRDTIGPEAQEFVSMLMVQLVRPCKPWAGLVIRPDMDNPLRPDLEARASVYEQMRHVWTVQEMRQMEGKPPLTGVRGDYASTVWMPSGQVPLGLIQPQTQAAEYGQLPTDSDGVGDVSKPAVGAPEKQDPGVATAAPVSIEGGSGNDDTSVSKGPSR